MKAVLEGRYLPKQEYDIVLAGLYKDGTPAFDVRHKGELMLRITSCLAPNSKPAEGHIFVKDWSENTGIIESLLTSGLIETAEIVTLGLVYAYECRMGRLKDLLPKEVKNDKSENLS